MNAEDTWFRKHAGEDLQDIVIAYFSAEYGVTECMQTYSGGLGVLAGDHLKSASDWASRWWRWGSCTRRVIFSST
jgi:starch phosphorylase